MINNLKIYDKIFLFIYFSYLLEPSNFIILLYHLHMFLKLNYLKLNKIKYSHIMLLNHYEILYELYDVLELLFIN